LHPFFLKRVIFDEVHYINDLERGVVWEEVIIMLPEHVGLIFLSATVPNTLEFADWVGRTKRKKVFVIKTDKRPVPLEHYLYYDKQLYKMCDAREGYLPSGHAAVTAAIRDKKEKKDAAKPKKAGASSGGGRFKAMTFSSQRGTWSKIIQMLHARNLLPAVAFVFSKNACMDLAQSLVHVDLTSRNEKSEIRRFIGESIKRLKGTDRQLPQVLVMTELLTRGIGVHHGGLLPIVKEIVEILFSTGLIKVLFATETFAMGVNMPTRTVLFNSTKKWDGKNKRDLLPGEYIQMSGRAGRRGLDTVGTVIVVVFDEVPESLGLKTMVTGRATKLESQFRLTYNMILNLLKMGGDFKIEDMIKRSFFESSNQKDTATFKERLKLGKRQIRDIEDIVCTKPGLDSPSPAPIVEYYSLIAQERLLMRQIQNWLVKSTYINELLCQGRVLVITVPGLPKQSLATVIRTPGTVPIPRAGSSASQTAEIKATSIRVMVLTQSPSPSLSDKYKVIVVDSASPDIDIISVKKLKRVEAERVDIMPDEVHISALVKELDSIRIESLPGLPGVFDPIKNLKIKDMDFVEMNQQLKDVRAIIATSPCHDCDLRSEHLAKQEHSTKLREQVAALEFLLSDQNLLMIPEYESRVRVLKHLGFVNQDGIVQVKGRVARELNNCDELIATELIFQNVLTDMPSDEIVALLSCFVFQEKSDNEPAIPDALKATQKILIDLATKLGELQVDLGVPITPQEFVTENVNPGLMECVYEWSHGRPFHEIVRLTDVQEGSIVRTIVRLDETLRDFRSAAKLIGNVDLATKMEEASLLIKRDIVFASSLYIADAPQQRQSSDGSAVAEE
jgi:antiviral helicase SKI2